MNFSSLYIDERLVSQLDTLGFESPTPIQSAAIPHILDGKDVMAGAQTGTGKTAAFGLPILHKLLQTPSEHKKARALILVPTRELAQQVKQSLVSYAPEAMKIEAVYGGVSLKPQMDSLRAGVDMIIATPGRLIDLHSKRAVDLRQVEQLVFDEADRMLDMGFKDEIRQVLRFLPKERQTLLFSATFDDSLFTFCKRILTNPELIEVDSRNSAAAKVTQTLYVIDSDRKAQFTSYLIGSKNWQQVLIFTKTKQGADALAKEMEKDGLPTQSIHGDKSQGARDRALEAFKVGDIRALVATDVAARGLDIGGLDYVINFDLPYIAEDYVHRIGRCGRAGREGFAISLMSLGEEYLLEEVEAVIKDRIPQQWYPGFEPDLTKEITDNRKNSRGAQKRRAKRRGQGGRSGNRRR